MLVQRHVRCKARKPAAAPLHRHRSHSGCTATSPAVAPLHIPHSRVKSKCYLRVLLSHVGLIEGSRRALVRRNAPPSLLERRTQNGQHGGRCRLNKDGFKTYLDDQRKRRGWTMWRKKKKNRNLARTGDLGSLTAESAGPISWLGIAVSGFQEHLLTETKGCATTASTRSDAASCLSSGSRPQGQTIS